MSGAESTAGPVFYAELSLGWAAPDDLPSGWRLAGHSDAPHSNSLRADPTELELLFKFVDGLGSRVPELVRSEFAAAQVTAPSVLYASPPTLRSRPQPNKS